MQQSLLIAQGARQLMVVENLEQDTTIVRVVVLESRKAQDRRPHVRVVSEQRVGHSLVANARPDDSQPGAHDVFLEVAVIPGEVARLSEAAGERRKRAGLRRGR